LQDLGETALDLLEILVAQEKRRLPTRGAAIETKCAGLFLLLRAVSDARLPLLAESTGYPSRGTPAPLTMLLLTLGLRWSGLSASPDRSLDPGLALWAAAEPPPKEKSLRHLWQKIAGRAHAGFQRDLLRHLAGQRLLGKERMHLYLIGLNDLGRCLVAGDDSSRLWPLGRVIKPGADIGKILTEFLKTWEEAGGCLPGLILADAVLIQDLKNELKGEVQLVLLPEERSEIPAGLDEAGAEAHHSGREELRSALDAFCHGRLGIPEADLTMGLTAIALLRLWSRWLRGFADSSVPFLLQNFIRRPGRVWTESEVIRVEIAPKPLDLVLEMAGYTAELAGIPWLGGRRVQFCLGES
jgi:hypothetical protein